MRKGLLGLGVFAFLAVGVGLWAYAGWTRPADPDTYSFAAAEYGTAEELVSATGLLQARDVLPVGTELAGKVIEVRADFNQTVQEGDVLLRLDDRMAKQRLKQADLGVEAARVALKQAEAARDTAKKTVDREKQRSPEVRLQVDLDLAVSQQKQAEVAVEAAEVKLKEAEESRRQAELALDLLTVRVPVLSDNSTADARPSGLGSLAAVDDAPPQKRSFLVLERKVSLNQQIGPPASGHLFSLAGSLERMQVHAQVAEGDINLIRRGLPTRFTLTGAADERSYQATVEDIHLVPVTERGAVFYKVLLDVPNQRRPDSDEWLLRPGLTATVEIVRRQHEHAWKVPASALALQMDQAPSDAARAKLDSWEARPDRASWRPVWVLDGQGKPYPMFVRTGGANAKGETGIQDTASSEALEWDPELHPDPSNPGSLPKFIIAMPSGKKSGWFNAPKIKF